MSSDDAAWTCCNACGWAGPGDLHGSDCPSCGESFDDWAITVWGEAQLDRWLTGERYDPTSPAGRADIDGEPWPSPGLEAAAVWLIEWALGFGNNDHPHGV